MIAPGTAVRVNALWPERPGPAHVRTPHYLRGRAGVVVRHLGDFPNPEDLAFARPAARLPLYHVAFTRSGIWPGASEGELLVEVFEPWLQPIERC